MTAAASLSPRQLATAVENVVSEVYATTASVFSMDIAMDKSVKNIFALNV